MMMMLFKGSFPVLQDLHLTMICKKFFQQNHLRKSAKMSGMVSVILNPVRYFMITGFVVLAVLYYDRLNLVVAGNIDFEQILPSAISEFVPVGLTGLLLAGLLAAFMSTFAGTLNAAQAYVVNDIYLRLKKMLQINKSKTRITLLGY